MTDSFLLLTWHIENASIPVQSGVNLRLRCHHLPHLTVLFVHPAFLSPLVKPPKKIPHSFLCMHVYSKTVFQIACFGFVSFFFFFFCGMEVRLFLAINHSGPLMTRSFPEKGPRERVGIMMSGHPKSPDISECSDKRILFVKHWVFQFLDTAGIDDPSPPKEKKQKKNVWGNLEVPTEHVTHSTPQKHN